MNGGLVGVGCKMDGGEPREGGVLRLLCGLRWRPGTGRRLRNHGRSWTLLVEVQEQMDGWGMKRENKGGGLQV